MFWKAVEAPAAARLSFNANPAFWECPQVGTPESRTSSLRNGAALQKSKCGPDSGPEQLNSGSRQSAFPRLPKFDKIATLEGNWARSP